MCQRRSLRGGAFALIAHAHTTFARDDAQVGHGALHHVCLALAPHGIMYDLGP